MKPTLSNIRDRVLIASICCSILFVVSMVIGGLAKWCGATNLGGVFATGWLFGVVCVGLIIVSLTCKVIEKWRYR